MIPGTPSGSATTASLSVVEPFTVGQIGEFLASFAGEDVSIQSLTSDDAAIQVRHLSLDSRTLQHSDCFIALQGEQAHGLDFLASVLLTRPACILADRMPSAEQQQLLEAHHFTRVIVVSALLKYVSPLANWFYHEPSQRIKVMGITGTNGKTSTAFYTAQLLEHLGHKVALIGTLGNGLLKSDVSSTEPALQSTLNTTPDGVTIQRLLSGFIEQGATWVVMEVSSHALALGRVNHITFDAVALTQVTRDHLDFHGTVKAYHATKMTLFTDYPARVKILNAKDSVGAQLLANLKGSVWSYGMTSVEPQEESRALLSSHWTLSGEALQLHSQGMSLRLKGQKKSGLPAVFDKGINISPPLMGRFNAENVLCALSLVMASMPFKERAVAWLPLIEAVSQLRPVSGRMQRVALAERSPAVIVDFAHTPDALRHVLSAIRQHLPRSGHGRLWCVFGCGGDRDQGKRPLMAQVVEALADEVMVTSDNPRFEDPQQIVDQIMSGFHASNKIEVELDRTKAIERVLSQAQSNDVVLIAGKGHEAYQDIQGVNVPFQDEQVVLDWQARQSKRFKEKKTRLDEH